MEWFPECGDGGLDRYFYEQLQAFSAYDVRGTALVSSCLPTEVGDIAVLPMAQGGATILQRWAGARQIAREALAGGVEVVNSHFAFYAFPWVDLIPQTVPFIVNFQGPWSDEIRSENVALRRRLVSLAAWQIERRVYARADRIITLSAAFRDLVHWRYGVPVERIRVVPGALHLEPYFRAPDRAEARRQWQLPANRPILLSVRRLVRRMGLELLIEAIAKVRQSFPEVLLLIGGKGPLHDELDERIRSLGLTHNVRMLGFVSEAKLPTLYAAADASIVPTVSLEGFGLITAESLAAGTPVIGTPIGATPEILRPLEPRLIFDEVGSLSMAAKIQQVLRGEIRLSPEACRDYVRQYGWPAVAPRLMSVYREAIEETRLRPG